MLLMLTGQPQHDSTFTIIVLTIAAVKKRFKVRLSGPDESSGAAAQWRILINRSMNIIMHGVQIRLVTTTLPLIARLRRQRERHAHAYTHYRIFFVFKSDQAVTIKGRQASARIHRPARFVIGTSMIHDDGQKKSAVPHAFNLKCIC
jgi:hypothetical protein